jgi:hypothetical protein
MLAHYVYAVESVYLIINSFSVAAQRASLQHCARNWYALRLQCVFYCAAITGCVDYLWSVCSAPYSSTGNVSTMVSTAIYATCSTNA